MPAMETGGSKTAAFAVWFGPAKEPVGAKQLLLQCGLCTCTKFCKLHRSLYRVIRISEFRYTEVLLYLFLHCDLGEKSASSPAKLTHYIIKMLCIYSLAK